MTDKKFFKSKEKLVINCDTEEKAIKLLKEFDRLGYKWINGKSYLDIDEMYWCENICYSNRGTYADKEFYEFEQITILKFEDIEFEGEKKNV